MTRGPPSGPSSCSYSTYYDSPSSPGKQTPIFRILYEPRHPIIFSFVPPSPPSISSFSPLAPRCSSGYYETRFQRRLRHYLYAPPEKNVGCMPVGLCHFRCGRSSLSAPGLFRAFLRSALPRFLAPPTAKALVFPGHAMAMKTRDRSFIFNARCTRIGSLFVRFTPSSRGSSSASSRVFCSLIDSNDIRK